MAKPRQKSSGKWEIGLRHPSLPSGRKYFTFNTQEEALAYARQWKLKKQTMPSPMELAVPAPDGVALTHVLDGWRSSGFAAPTQTMVLQLLARELGSIRLANVNYQWLTGYLQHLKVEKNLAPGSIKQRIQALGRAIDEYLRLHQDMKFKNPVRLLPKGYSTYTEADATLAEARGGIVKTAVVRDRRLMPGEHERIVQVLSGYEHPDRLRGLQLKGGDALLTLYLLIVNSGLRLREAYTLKRGQVDMDEKVIRVQNTKQWRGKVSFRDVPMRPEVHQALCAYFETRAPMLAGAWLFPFMEETGVTSMITVSRRLSARFRVAFRYMGIADLREHDLRHEATCRWLELKDTHGRDMFRLEELNKIMGWAPGSLMAQRYASFRGVDLARRLWPTQTIASHSMAVA